MKIYNYNSVTGEYINESQADESPLEKGVYLIPANATTLEPPMSGTNQVVIFENNTWSLKSDFRKETFYDSNNNYAAIVIDFIGDIPSNYVYSIPDSVTLENLKTKITIESNTNCYARFNLGITYNNNEFDINDTAKANISLIINLLNQGKVIDLKTLEIVGEK